MSIWSNSTIELPASHNDDLPTSDIERAVSPTFSTDSNDGPCDSTTTWNETRLYQWLGLTPPDTYQVFDDYPVGEEFPDQSHWIPENDDVGDDLSENSQSEEDEDMVSDFEL